LFYSVDVLAWHVQIYQTLSKILNILFSIYKICTFYVITQKYPIIMHFDANTQKYEKKKFNSRIYVLRNVKIFNQNFFKLNVEQYASA